MFGACLSVLGICSSANGQPAVGSLREAFDPFESFEAELHNEEVWTSSLMPKPETLVADVKVVRNGDNWGAQVIRPSGKRPGFFSRFNIVYRDHSALAINTHLRDDSPMVSGSGFSAIYYDKTISGVDEASQEYWPTDGNVELPFCGILFGVSLFSREGYLTDPHVESGANGDVVIRSSSRYGLIEIHTPSDGGLPAQIELTQLPEHFFHGKRIGDQDSSGTSIEPAGPTLEMRTTVTFEFDPTTKNRAPSNLRGWTILTRTTYPQERFFQEESRTTLKSLKTGGTYAARDFWFGLTLPATCRVQAHGAEHLRYAWDGEWATINQGDHSESIRPKESSEPSHGSVGKPPMPGESFR
jgi:hypothetical protein